MKQKESFYAARRARFLEAMGEGVAIFPAAPVFIRNRDVEHDYRQDSDLYYLLGFDEPECALILDNRGNNAGSSNAGSSPKSVVFLRPKDKLRETWDGLRLGVEDAPAILGVDEAYPISELGARLPDYLEDAEQLVFALGKDSEYDAQILRAIEAVRGRSRKKVSPPRAIVDPSHLLHELRLIKGPEEIERMRRAAEISSAAHIEAMKITRPGLYEYQLEAELARHFRGRGAERPAYPSIVGSGPNATILHHRKNDRLIDAGDLILIDAGAEYDYYAADITRTFPASGRFTEPQRAVYAIVLRAQEAAIEAAVKGATLDDVHLAATRLLIEGLIELGVLKGSVDEALSSGSYAAYYMHRTSHYLGMDVHDVGAYHKGKEARPLEPGMVITIEPGLYFSVDADCDPIYRGIGIRIEDDILITESGNENLTAATPKGIEELEEIVGSASR